MKASSTKCWQRAEASNAFALGFLSPFRRKLPLSRGVDCQHDFSTDFRHCRHGFLPNLKILNRRTDYGLHADAEAANGCCVPDLSLRFRQISDQPTEGANGLVRSRGGSSDLQVCLVFSSHLSYEKHNDFGLEMLHKLLEIAFRLNVKIDIQKMSVRHMGRWHGRQVITDYQEVGVSQKQNSVV